MPISKVYSGSMELMRNALNLRFEKQGLIQSNIANMETPGYNMQDFSFEKVMEGVMTEQGQLTKTHAKHISLDPVQVAKTREFSREERPVDLDEEMLKLSENQLMYDLTTRLISRKFVGLRFAIDEGGK